MTDGILDEFIGDELSLNEAQTYAARILVSSLFRRAQTIPEGTALHSNVAQPQLVEVFYNGRVLSDGDPMDAPDLRELGQVFDQLQKAEIHIKFKE